MGKSYVLVLFSLFATAGIAIPPTGHSTSFGNTGQYYPQQQLAYPKPYFSPPLDYLYYTPYNVDYRLQPAYRFYPTGPSPYYRYPRRVCPDIYDRNPYWRHYCY